MLDIKYIRQNPDAVKAAMQHRGVSVDIDAILAADERHRAALAALEAARAQQNAASKGPMEPAQIEALKASKEHIRTLQAESDDLAAQLDALVAPLPNIPLDDTPVGADSTGNIEVSVYGEKPVFSFTPRHYMDIAEPKGLVDTETAGTVSGTRFGYLMGGVARLEFALLQYALSKMTDGAFVSELIARNNLSVPATPFVPVIPPVMIRPAMMRAMGFAERAGIERGDDEIYYLPKDDLYLVGTSEQSIGPMFYDRILTAEQLPVRYVGFSTCFRRESGAAGKDSRGILRVHQFDKLEMFSVTAPEHSVQEHRLILAVEEALMQGLGLHYRVVRLCTGDIGQASAATYDIETWMPGQDTYRETHSCSNTTEFQSRALKTRMRNADGTTGPVHMLNGTVFSMNRPIIAILEQFQQEDGSVRVPDVLRPYLGGLETLAA
jgi:seryl-tRNA synthetase